MQNTGKYELCLPVEQTTDLEDTVLLSKSKQKKILLTQLGTYAYTS